MIPLAPLLFAIVMPTRPPVVQARPTVPVAIASGALSFGKDVGTVLLRPLKLTGAEGLMLSAAGVGTAVLLPYDVPLYRQLHRRVQWTFHRRSVFNATAYLGEGVVDLGIVTAFSVGDERARGVALAGTEALAAVAVTSVVGKHVFRVARPNTDPNQKHYFDRFGDDALPSGHTMSAFATATVISSAYPQVAPFAYGCAGLVGVSVMERGWHWPSDVLLGAALGIVLGRGAVLVNEKVHITPTGSGMAASGTF